MSMNVRGHTVPTKVGWHYPTSPFSRGADVASTRNGIIAMCQKVSRNRTRNSVGAAFLAGLLVAFQPAAHATIDVPTKAVWSVTDIDSLQFCAKCNPDDVASATRTENYKRTIIDTVAMGARQILVHARPGAARATRLGEFSSALAAYNAAAPVADRACMAVMYADYGTAHTDSEITSLYTTAWNSTGANYCSSAGRPVVATLSDRPDETCAPARVTNIINRLRTLPSGTIPSAVHWVAAFGERSEYGDWNSACRDKISGPGIPITYSYLEMANDDPASATDAAARRDAVKATGGRYILGIPSASAQNCGDFCGSDADSTSIRHTDFGGFNRLLAAWRAGSDNVAYTYGPGGPYGKDQFASSAVRCDANDLVTGATACQTIAAADAPLVPGVPTSGAVVDPPIEPGTGQCASSTVPPAAKAAGLTRLAFCDDFSVNSVAAGSSAAERTIGGQKKWTTERASTFGSAPLDPPSAFTHNAATGTMKVRVVYGEYNWFMTASQPRNGRMNGFDIVRQPKFYIEIRWKLNKGSAGARQPVIWSMDNCHLHKGNAGMSCPGTRYLEPDWYEYTYGGLFMHDWKVTPKSHIYCNYAADRPSTDGVWFTAGQMYQNNPAKIIGYFNDVYKTEMAATRCPAINDIDEAHLPILIGAKPGEEVEIDWVKVWLLP